MYRVATVQAFDVLDQVHVSAQVTLYEGSLERTHSIEFSCATTVDGVGSGDGAVWLRDALVALAETL